MTGEKYCGIVVEDKEDNETIHLFGESSKVDYLKCVDDSVILAQSMWLERPVVKSELIKMVDVVGSI